jgi:cytochrome P450
LFDRFTPEEKAKRPQLCHMPFGFGPRSCIAMRLALLQAKIAFIEVLKKYTFVRAAETEVYVANNIGKLASTYTFIGIS